MQRPRNPNVMRELREWAEENRRKVAENGTSPTPSAENTTQHASGTVTHERGPEVMKLIQRELEEWRKQNGNNGHAGKTR
jgi:hypothetical protein